MTTANSDGSTSSLTVILVKIAKNNVIERSSMTRAVCFSNVVISY